MSGWLRCASALLALTCGLPAAAQDAVARADEHWRAGRTAAALEAARAIEDRAMRAEWEFQILYGAGDLPGALAAARDGLEHAPEHLGLLQNALVCTLALGQGENASGLAARLGSALERSELDDATKAASRERIERLTDDARRLRELESTASAALARARVVTILLLTASLLALAFLARPRPTPRPAD